MPKNLVCLSFFVALVSSSPSAGEVSTELLNCAGISDDAPRLACFDAAVASMDQGKSTIDTPATAGEENPATVDSFGMTDKLARDKGEEVLESITAVIVSIKEKPRGQRVLHLDNGQTWEEKSPTRGLRLQVGQSVEIEAGAFGSFSLSPRGTNRFTKVTRTR